MSRWKAGAIHFSISLAIFLGLLAVILVLWYPGILFTIDGGWEGLRLIIGVDLIAGPLMTLVIFKSGKPGLKFDLSCIAVFQAACMAAGMTIVYNERPLALVLAYDTIYSVNAQEFLQYERDPALLAEFPGRYPKSLYVELPESDVAAEIASIRAQFIGDPLYIQTENYRAMPDQADELKNVFRVEEALRRELTQQSANQPADSCGLSRFISPVVSGIVCFDTQSRRIVEFYEVEAAEILESEAEASSEE